MVLNQVKCPTCSKWVRWEAQSVYRPFCCKRCQLIDLGEWASEERRIPGRGEQPSTDEWNEEEN